MNKNKKPSIKKKKYFVVFLYGYLVIPSLDAAARISSNWRPLV